MYNVVGFKWQDWSVEDWCVEEGDNWELMRRTHALTRDQNQSCGQF